MTRCGPEHTLKIEIEADYVALTTKRAALLEVDDLDRDCTKLGVIWYCLNPSVIRYTSEHSCVMALYMDNPQEVNKYCKIKFYPNYTPKPTIMMDSTHIMFIAMPLPWSASCSRNKETRRNIQPAPVVVMELESTCWCEIQMGEFLVHTTPPSCSQNTFYPSEETRFVFNTAVSYAMREEIKEINTVSDTLVKVATKEGEKAISGTLLTHEQIDLTLPNLDFLKPENLGLEQQHLLDELPLKQVVEALRTGKPWFNTASKDNTSGTSMDYVKHLLLNAHVMIGIGAATIVIGTVAAIFTGRIMCSGKQSRDLTQQMYEDNNRQWRKMDRKMGEFNAIQMEVFGGHPNPSFMMNQSSYPDSSSQASLLHQSNNSSQATLVDEQQMPSIPEETFTPSPSPSPQTARTGRSSKVNSTTLPLTMFMVLTILTLTFDSAMTAPVGPPEPTALRQTMGEPSTTSRTEQENDEHWLGNVSVTNWITIAGINALLCIIFLVALVITYRIPITIRTFRTNKTCPFWFCQSVKDTCDIYLQVGTMYCPNSAAVYLGSLLGPPMGLKFGRTLETSDLALSHGTFFDLLEIAWDHMDMEYQGETFSLPDQIKIVNPITRYKLHHYFKTYRRTKMCNLILVSGDNLIIRHLKNEKVANPVCHRQPLKALPPPNVEVDSDQPQPSTSTGFRRQTGRFSVLPRARIPVRPDKPPRLHRSKSLARLDEISFQPKPYNAKTLITKC